MLSFFSGLILGFFVSIPVGPVNVATISASIKGKGWYGVSMGGGAALMDGIYMFLAIYGITLLDLNATIIFYIKIVGIVLLFILGIIEYRSSDKLTLHTADSPGQNQLETNGRGSRKYTKRGLFKNFSVGVLLYVTNPTILIFFSAVAAVMKKYELIGPSLLSNFYVSSGMLLGTFSWFFLLSKFIERKRDKIKLEHLKRINKGAGVLLIVIGGVLLIKEIIW